MNRRMERLLRDLEKGLKIIEEITSTDLEDFLNDLKSRYALRMAIVEIIETAANIGLILLREHGAHEVKGYPHIFDKMAELRILSADVGLGMRRMARLRNLIIHRYWEVDDSRIYREATENGLGIVRRFLEEVRERCR